MLGPKTVVEKKRLIFDYTEHVTDAETLQSVDDPVITPAGLVTEVLPLGFNAKLINGLTAEAIFIDGTLSEDYQIEMRVTTSESQILEICDTLQVRACVSQGTISKDPDSTILRNIDFSGNPFKSGEVITTIQNFTITAAGNVTEITPLTVPLRTPNQQLVQLQLVGGTDGEDYTLQFEVVTDGGQLFETCGVVEVRSCAA